MSKRLPPEPYEDEAPSPVPSDRMSWGWRIVILLLVAGVLGGGYAWWDQKRSAWLVRRAAIEKLEAAGAVFWPPRDSAEWADILFGEVVNVDFTRPIAEGLAPPSIDNETLAPISVLTTLQNVNLEGAPITTASLESLAPLVNLRMLNLSGTGLGDEGLENLLGMTQLKRLLLDRTKIGDASLASIGKLSELEKLSLRDTWVTDAGLESLKPLVKLRELDLTGTRIGNKGLVPLGELTALESLMLSGTRITDAGISSLDPLDFLVELWLVDTKISVDRVEILRRARPNLKIVRQEPPAARVDLQDSNR